MHHVKGQRLYVNVSAAQARRRLEGHGHGVRKVHSNGRNRAVIIHTAVGEHLDRLRRMFADVGSSTTESELGEPIQNLRNLGAEAAQWLQDADVRSIPELRALGAIEAFRRVRRRRPDCSLQLLWALAAGLEDRDWQTLTSEEQTELRQLLAADA